MRLLKGGNATRSPETGWRQAAGLLLLFPIAGAAHVVLTVRAATLFRHGGQVSLPGGVIEPGETVEQAALREASEEIGLSPAGVTVAGRLTPVDIEVSGFRLNPVVATSEVQPSFLPAHREVAKILLVPVATLLDPSAVRWTTAQRPGGGPMTVPAFHFAGEVIWGATAMLLAEFLTVLGWPGPSLDDPEAGSGRHPRRS